MELWFTMEKTKVLWKKNYGTVLRTINNRTLQEKNSGDYQKRRNFHL